MIRNLVSTIIVALAAVLPAQAAEWLVLESEHFAIYTRSNVITAGTDAAVRRRVLRRLEALRSVGLAPLGADERSVRAQPRFEIYMLHGTGEPRKFSPRPPTQRNTTHIARKAPRRLWPSMRDEARGVLLHQSVQPRLSGRWRFVVNRRPIRPRPTMGLPADRLHGMLARLRSRKVSNAGMRLDRSVGRPLWVPTSVWPTSDDRLLLPAARGARDGAPGSCRWYATGPGRHCELTTEPDSVLRGDCLASHWQLSARMWK
jgi:hypothetical protein